MRLLIFSLFLASSLSLSAQDRIALENPSFEDVPQTGRVPQSWDNCGALNQTPPDIHPNDFPPYHFFGVNLRPDDGWTYLGMVARQSDTREGVTQKLAMPMKAGAQYLFSLSLARSKTYFSGSMGEVDFTRPVVLRIWGGDAPCAPGELLALTVPVENTEWLEYVFTLSPTQAWPYLTLEAFYAGEERYNGHVLLDHCSDLVLLPPPLLQEDLEAMDDAKLETTVLESVKKQLSIGKLGDLTAVPYLGVCYKSSVFEQEVAEMGLRRFVNNAPYGELTSLIRALEALRVEKNLALLKDVTRISRKNKNQISPEEYQYFERADAAFEENLASEPIRDKRLEYIRKHRGEIIAELLAL